MWLGRRKIGMWLGGRKIGVRIAGHLSKILWRKEMIRRLRKREMGGWIPINWSLYVDIAIAIFIFLSFFLSSFFLHVLHNIIIFHNRISSSLPINPQ
jgi:hypothetical protein